MVLPGPKLWTFLFFVGALVSTIHSTLSVLVGSLALLRHSSPSLCHHLLIAGLIGGPIAYLLISVPPFLILYVLIETTSTSEAFDPSSLRTRLMGHLVFIACFGPILLSIPQAALAGCLGELIVRSSAVVAGSVPGGKAAVEALDVGKVAAGGALGAAFFFPLLLAALASTVWCVIKRVKKIRMPWQDEEEEEEKVYYWRRTESGTTMATTTSATLASTPEDSSADVGRGGGEDMDHAPEELVRAVAAAVGTGRNKKGKVTFKLDSPQDSPEEGA